MLAGRPGTETIVRDPTGRAVDTVNSVPPREGRNVHLALDRIMQENLQNVLGDTMAQWRAKSATGIVLDPRNGRVLAMAVSPSFASDRFSSTSPDVTRLRAVTDTYEPGSTFKIVPVSAALSEGLVTPSNSFTLPPVIQVADRTIHESDRTVTEQMSVAQIVAKSSNVGAVTLAELVNQKRFYHWIRRFGFGRQTGVDFPGESAGILLPESKWSGSSIGNLAIGQGISVTALQMASAYAAIANMGVWIQPHFVTSVGGHKAFRPKKRRILSPHVANEMVSMLKDVVATGGTGDNARVPGLPGGGQDRHGPEAGRGRVLEDEVRLVVRRLRPGDGAAARHPRLGRRAARPDLRRHRRGAGVRSYRALRPAVPRRPSGRLTCSRSWSFHGWPPQPPVASWAHPRLSPTSRTAPRTPRPGRCSSACAAPPRTGTTSRRRRSTAAPSRSPSITSSTLAAPQLVVADTRAAMAQLAVSFFGDPSAELDVVGVTGTSGKTTTTFLVHAILEAAGRRPGLLGTIESRVGDERVPAVRTTPESVDLQRTLRAMVDAGNRSVAMEATSHGSELRRLDGVRFAALAFTNLGQDHLDFHGTIERYFEAKRRLFGAGRRPRR